MDFDDMLVYTNQILETYPVVRDYGHVSSIFWWMSFRTPITPNIQFAESGARA